MKRVGQVSNWQVKKKLPSLYSGTPANTHCGPTDLAAITVLVSKLS